MKGAHLCFIVLVSLHAPSARITKDTFRLTCTLQLIIIMGVGAWGAPAGTLGGKEGGGGWGRAGGEGEEEGGGGAGRGGEGEGEGGSGVGGVGGGGAGAGGGMGGAWGERRQLYSCALALHRAALEG